MRKSFRVGGKQAHMIEEAKNGTLDLSDWDIEELLYGMRRNKNGNFQGRRPAVIPRQIYDELAKRVKMEVGHKLRGVANEHIVPVLEQIMTGSIDPDDIPALKLKAAVAQDLLDRFVIGKKEEVAISGTMKHEAVIANVTVQRDIPDPDEDDVIDVEAVDEEDEDWTFDE